MTSPDRELVRATMERLIKFARGRGLETTGARNHRKEKGEFSLPAEDPFLDAPRVVRRSAWLFKQSVRISEPDQGFIEQMHAQPWPELVRIQFDSCPLPPGGQGSRR